MKILKAKSKRSHIFAIITLALIITLFGLNLLFSIVGLNNSIYIDMTPEELYTVSDVMLKECSFLNEIDNEKELKIIFCNDPDNLIENTVTRITYLMALKLQKKFDNLKVEAENIKYNPTKVSKYKATSLTEIKTTDVIVAYGDRYRIVSADSFWASADGVAYSFYNGEYKLATLLKSVTRANDGDPAAYFLTGHGETCYNKDKLESAGTLATEQFKNLFLDRGLRVEILDLSKHDKVPTDCAVLVINNPTLDFVMPDEKLDSFFYESDIEKIDRYLTEGQGSLMVAKSPEVSLPTFERYLEEWGFSLSKSTLSIPKDETKPDTPDNRTDIMNGVYDTDDGSYAYAIYGEFSSVSSAPKTLFSGTGYIDCAFGADTQINEAGSFDVTRVYTSFIKSPEKSTPYTSDGKRGATGSYDIAAVSVRTCFDNMTAERTYSYVFCVNDGDFFSNELLGNAAYANFDIMSALVNNISRRDIYASTDLGGSTLNSDRVGGKEIVSTTLYEEDTETLSTDGQTIVVNRGIGKAAKVLISVAVAVMPAAALVLGVIIYLRRTYM